VRKGRALYRREAGVGPSDLQVTDPRSVEQLWRDMPSSARIASIPARPSQDPPLRVDTDFMSINVIGTYLIRALGRRRAHRRPDDRI